MASLTIRNLDDNVKAALRLRAAQHGRSMEEEARQVLRQSLEPVALGGCLAERIGRRFAGLDTEGLHVLPCRPSPVVPQVDEGC